MNKCRLYLTLTVTDYCFLCVLYICIKYISLLKKVTKIKNKFICAHILLLIYLSPTLIRILVQTALHTYLVQTALHTYLVQTALHTYLQNKNNLFKVSFIDKSGNACPRGTLHGFFYILASSVYL